MHYKMDICARAESRGSDPLRAYIRVAQISQQEPPFRRHA